MLDDRTTSVISVGVDDTMFSGTSVLLRRLRPRPRRPQQALLLLLRQAQGRRHHHHDWKCPISRSVRPVPTGGVFTAILGLLGLLHLDDARDQHDGKEDEEEEEEEGGHPVFTREQVEGREGGVWVTLGGGVYDVTRLARSHPGGAAAIESAAGRDLAGPWAAFPVHRGDDRTREMLEGCRIGSLKKEDVLRDGEDGQEGDPFSGEPDRTDSPLVVVAERPFCGETPSELLAEEFLTPRGLFFVRNHLPAPPDLREEEYRLRVKAGRETRLYLTLEELRRRFPKWTVTAALQCAGNRRSEMMVKEEEEAAAAAAEGDRTPTGPRFGCGAVGCARWSGARLGDVLRAAGVTQAVVGTGGGWHVRFCGADSVDGGVGVGDSATTSYACSIPLSRAVDERAEVLLAYEMNGEPLCRDHGFPVRAVVPGATAARSVKWLTEVEVSGEEADSHWQRADYKVHGPGALASWEGAEEEARGKLPPVLDFPVNSAICQPPDGKTISPGMLKVRGYALSGGGNGISRVDVSVDRGASWAEARIRGQDAEEEGRRCYGWTLWEADVDVPATATSEVEVWCRALDSSYNVQPEESVWNLRGILANGYSKRTYRVEGGGGGEHQGIETGGKRSGREEFFLHLFNACTT